MIALSVPGPPSRQIKVITNALPLNYPPPGKEETDSLSSSFPQPQLRLLPPSLVFPARTKEVTASVRQRKSYQSLSTNRH